MIDIIGLDAFGDEEMSVFETLNILSDWYRLEVIKGIFDEIHWRNNHNIIPNSAKIEWQLDTIMLAKFQDSLSAGNLDLAGQIIEFIQVKKRKANELQWSNVTYLLFDNTINYYEYIDKFVEAGEIYEYAIIPIAFGGFEGNYVINDIFCQFESTWLFNKNEIYKLMYNLEYGSIDTVVPNHLFEPIGAKYPIVNYNGNLRYKKGNIKCMLIASTTQSNQIDVRQEKLERNQIMNFLVDRKSKILKDSAGNYMMVSIIGQPRLVPNNNLNQKLYDVEFEFVEVGNPYDENSLQKADLK